MYYWTPKRIKELKARGYKLREVAHDPGPELRKRAREQALQETVPHNDIEEANKLTSSQATSGKRPSRRLRVQASSQSLQAPGSHDQGTSAQAHDPGCKQQE
jgi:hypothetical protein